MRVLVVDDDSSNRDALVRLLGQSGYESRSVGTGEAGQRLLQTEHFDAVVLDVKMPGMNGLELLGWITREGPVVPVVMVSAFGEIADAVEAMKLGAQDYLVKPVEPDELLLRLGRAIQSARYEAIASGQQSRSDVPPLGVSEPMREIEATVGKIAATPSTVLITGESGTGKEVVARRIHELSDVSAEPFVPVNLGGIPENLLESELFGHERGAFTGAEKRRIGMFETAGRGTLFLDEVGEMPVSIQVKLLRTLQDRSIRRLGSSTEVPVAARIIAATNRDLTLAVADGLFREDLFYRLNVVRIEIPALRERKEDIPHLAAAILVRVAGKLNRPLTRLAPAAIEKLMGYSFPGNVRELENIIERAAIFASGDTVAEQDILVPDAGVMDVPPPRSLKALERDAIARALRRWDGNRTRAAEELGISRRSVISKIQEYGLE